MLFLGKLKMPSYSIQRHRFALEFVDLENEDKNRKRASP